MDCLQKFCKLYEIFETTAGTSLVANAFTVSAAIAPKSPAFT